MRSGGECGLQTVSTRGPTKGVSDMERMKHLVPALAIAAGMALVFSQSAAAGLRHCGSVGDCASGSCAGEVEGHVCGFNRACFFDLRVCPDDTVRCFCTGGGVLFEQFDEPLIIEDNNPADLSRIVDFPGHAAILDMVIQFEVEHPHIGDLVMTLTHGNTTVSLVDRPGRTGSGPGCDADLSCARRIFLGDAASAPIECGSPTQCALCFPGGQVPEGFYAPNQPLGTFSGQDAFGPWRLSIADHAAGNIGYLCGWSLSIRTAETTAVEPATWGTIKATYD